MKIFGLVESDYRALELVFSEFKEMGYASEAKDVAGVLDAAATDLELYDPEVKHTTFTLTRALLVSRLRNMAALFRTEIPT